MEKGRVKRLSALIIMALLVLLSSCVTRSPLGDEQYFQALGLDGQFVITVNADLLDVGKYVDTSDKAVSYIADRMGRLSIALYDPNGGSISTDFSEFDYYGALEGDYSKSLINSALSLSSLFTKQKDDDSKLKFFVDNDSGLEVAVPTKGIILFSSTNVVDNYRQTYTSERVSNISSDDAARLAAAQIGVYVSNPRTMVDLGFEITKASLDNIESILLVMNDDIISVDFRIKSEELANSFSVLIKAGYVGNLRKNGEKIDVASLKRMFTQELSTVSVNDMPLSKEMKDSIESIVFSLLDAI
ncbi:MAG: hypothetical protein IJ863_06190 [Spirochaetales bacterium]|nr:hypothetical protein [Spirochaetales bacterium]